MLYIESPAGVGYSLNKNDDLSTNDVQQSLDALAALLDFYSKFPEFLTNELFISGESYGGIYVPYLAYQVNEYNK
jgi:carboxypeptidase C (cathepsin A)